MLGEKLLSIRVPEDVLERLRRKYAVGSDTEAVQRAVAACSEEPEGAGEAPAVTGWAALDRLVGIIEGDGTPGADEHDRWGLGAAL